jgi:predicted lipid-binding transport protein (Tim44 family)
MQRIFLSMFAVFLAFAFPIYDAEAKRMGSGKNSGMQRQATPMKRDASPQQTQNAPAAGQNAAAGAAPKRNWMGPIAGLAAGLGIAALLSHFGLGEGVANILMMVLLALAAFMLVRWFLNRNKSAMQQPMQQPMQYAGQAAGGDQNTQQPMRFEAPASSSHQGAVVPGSIYDTSNQDDANEEHGPVAKPAPSFPPGFDEVAFARQAKVNFIRMQAANDAGNLDDLREFTTPEMYAELKMDIDERQGKEQHTEVMTINAETLEALEDSHRQIVSVRFYGTLREDDQATISFDEIWHMTKPLTGNQGWVVAGIQQND